MFIRKVSTLEDKETCYKIRIEVFVHEQSVPLEDEIDAEDSISTHFLAFYNNEAVGTARLVPDLNGVCHFGRLAELKSARKKGLAKLLVESVHAEAKLQGFTKSTIHAQTYLTGFYTGLGYQADSTEVFIEDGLEHLSMTLTF